MSNDINCARRQFLAALGLATGSHLLGSTPTGRAESLATTFPPDAPRALRPAGADLGCVFADLERLAAKRRFADSFLGDRFRDLGEFKAAARQRILDVLLYRPEPIEPKADVIDRVDRGDHIREKIVFSTAPHFRVPAYVLLPKLLTKPAPAIVDLHSHGGMFLFGKEKVIDFGDNHPAMVQYHERNYDGRPTATALVRRGYVVISIDAFFFGERRLLLDADLDSGWDRSRYSLDDVKRLNLKCRNKEDTLVKGLTFAGLTWPGIVFWDDMRTVDYLVTRPEVDPHRIGCVGISMGGYRSIFLAALDDRIAAACVTGFMSTVGPMMKAHLDTHSWVHFLPGLHQYLDWSDVMSLAAPRAVLVQQCSQDRLFPLAGMKESIAKIAAAYRKAKSESKFSGRFYDVPHRFTTAMQDEAFEWFDKQLGR